MYSRGDVLLINNKEHNCCQGVRKIVETSKLHDLGEISLLSEMVGNHLEAIVLQFFRLRSDDR